MLIFVNTLRQDPGRMDTNNGVKFGGYTMKQSLFIISFFFLCKSYSQTVPNTIVMEETTWVSGIYHRTNRDTITLTAGEPDLNFYRARFNILYHLPDSLTKAQFKNRTVKIWGLEKNQGNFNTNWLNT